MKTLKILLGSFIILFATMGCEKEELNQDASFLKATVKKMEEVKMVPFKGKFLSTPADVILIECADINPGTGVVVPALKFNIVSGNASHLGILDAANSPLIVEDCSFDSQTGFLAVTLNITYKNKNGDGIRVLGISNISIEGPASGSYEVVEGYGKFEGATGSMTTEGFFNGETGVAEFSAEGFVTQPNR